MAEILSLKFEVKGQTKNCYIFELKDDLKDIVFYPKKIWIDQKILTKPPKEITIVIT